MATGAISIELAGVLVVGLASYVVPDAFPDKTVWSHFGSGYGYVPLVLPLLGMWWLRRGSAAESLDPGGRLFGGTVVDRHRVAAAPRISDDVREIVTKALDS